LSFYSISALFNGLTSIVLLPILFFKKPKSTESNLFLLFLLAVIEWSIFYLAWLITPNASLAEYLARTCMIGVIFMPPIFLHFVASLTGTKINKALLVANYLLSIVFISTVYSSLYLGGMKSIIGISLWPIPRAVFPLTVLHFVVVYLYTHVLMWRKIKSSSGLIRNQIIYVFIGTLLGGLAGATNYLSWYTSIPPFLNIFTSIYVIMVTYAIVKHRLMNISVVISRTVAWAITILFLGSIYVLLAWLYRTFVTAQIDWVFLAGTVLYGVLVGVSFQKIRLFLQTAADRAFIKGWYDYREVLRKVATGLAKALTREDIVKTLYPIFQDDIDISESHLYFLDRSSATFIEWDPQTLEPRKESALTKDYSLIKQVSAQKEVAVFDKKLCVPSFSGGDLVALFVLGKKRSEDEYNDDDIELFRTVSEYVAIALEYIVKPYEEVKERFATTEKKLFETEKQLERSQRLASLGTVAAGVAHEIRNPLAVISLKTQNLPDTEELRDFKNIVIANTERATAIIKQMVMLSKPKERKEIEINLNELIDATLKLFTISRIRLILDLKELPLIKCDPDEIKQVFINLIDNALRAMAEGGDLTIASRYVEEEASVQIEISDTGMGIPDEIKEKIFDPFFSTRHEGAGLGLSIAYRIVREHGGSMEFKSKVGKGTTFILKFPAIKT